MAPTRGEPILDAINKLSTKFSALETKVTMLERANEELKAQNIKLLQQLEDNVALTEELFDFINGESMGIDEAEEKAESHSEYDAEMYAMAEAVREVEFKLKAEAAAREAEARMRDALTESHTRAMERDLPVPDFRAEEPLTYDPPETKEEKNKRSVREGFIRRWKELTT